MSLSATMTSAAPTAISTGAEMAGFQDLTPANITLYSDRNDYQRGKMGLCRVVGFIPFQESEYQVQHVHAGFFNGRFGCDCDLAAYGIK